jgi:hypothetical protein
VANSKQKPVPEGAKRSPGKSKFSIPRKEALPIDGSYLDRLFADYEKQTQETQTPGGGAAPVLTVAEVVEETPVIDRSQSEIRDSSVTPDVPVPPGDGLQQPKPGDPVPFPQKETPPAKADGSGVAHSNVTPASTIRSPESAALLPQAKTHAARAETFTDDALLLDRWKKKHRLGKGEVKVLRVMLQMCRDGDSDHCYVKIPQLMVGADLKERQTQLVMRSLQELGLIEKLAEYSNADRLGTKYRIAIEFD